VCLNPPGFADYAEKLDAFLAKHGLTKNGGLWHVEELNIHSVPREFQYRAEIFDDRFMFAGGLLERRFRAVWKSGGDAHKPTILISGYSGLPETQYSNERYFRVFIDALAGAACHCVLSIGDSVSPHSFDPLPPNFEINQRAAHLEILQHADLFACHGGMGSTLEALRSGVPVLAIPATPYTQEVAYRVLELGLGASLPPEQFSVESVREAAERMLESKQLRERVNQMKWCFSRSEGAAAAADRVERYLSSL
jgi:MGT family glycosyltransferase